MRVFFIFLVGVGACVGCGQQASMPADTGTAKSDMSKLMPPKPPVLGPVEPEYPRGDMTDSPKSAQPTTGPDTETVKAEVGVGLQGRRLEDDRLVQMIVTPARALFRTEQRIAFEVQIPHALNLYQAVNGSKPKSHDEFMEQIIKANRIQLPALPAGERYVYDPGEGELMVERPAR